MDMRHHEGTSSAPSVIRRKPRHELVHLAGDLLPVFDIAALVAAAYSSIRVVAMTVAPYRNAWDLWNEQRTAAWCAAIMASVVLFRLRPFIGVAARVPYGRLREFSIRYLTFAGCVLAAGFATRATDTLPRSVMALYLVIGYVLTLAGRFCLGSYLRRLERRGILSQGVAVIGAGPVADRLIRHLLQARPQGVRLLGVFDDRVGPMRQPSMFGPAGTVSDLVALGQRETIDWVLVTLPGTAEGRLLPLMHRLKSLAITVGLCPQNVGLALPCGSIDYVGDGLPVTLLADRPIKMWSSVIKGAEDLVLGGLATLLLLPIMGLIATAIKLDSPGPVLFKQRRHATNNVEFDIFKFRTMRWNGGIGDGVLHQTSRSDARVTRVGRILRSCSLDELPQLFNVLRGEMSLVGPRPHAVNMRTEQRLGHEIIDTYPHRHRVKPGITGWSQVNGLRGATETASQLSRRVEYDLYYVEHWSPWFDLRILLMTVWVVMRGTNAR